MCLAIGLITIGWHDARHITMSTRPTTYVIICQERGSSLCPVSLHSDQRADRMRSALFSVMPHSVHCMRHSHAFNMNYCVGLLQRWCRDFPTSWMVTTLYLNILILGTVCDVLYECMLNSTAKLRINQFLSYYLYVC